MELNNFKLKPTALLLGFTAAEINMKSSWKDKASGIQWQERVRSWLPGVATGNSNAADANTSVKHMVVHHRLIYDFTGFLLRNWSELWSPASAGAKARSCLPARNGPHHLQTQKPQPGWKRPSFSKAGFLAHTIPVKGKWKVTYFKGLSGDWDELGAGKPVAGSMQVESAGRKCRKAHHLADNQE